MTKTHNPKAIMKMAKERDPELLKDLAEIVEEVNESINSYREKGQSDHLEHYPAGGCSVVSSVLAQVLLNRGYGVWSLSSELQASSSHTWLTLFDGLTPLITVDASIHQFPQLSHEPVVDFRLTPYSQQTEWGKTHDDIDFPPSQEWHQGGCAVPIRAILADLHENCTMPLPEN